MGLPTLAVTPGTGAMVNTLPPGGQAVPANSLPVTLDTTVETAAGTSATAALAVQGVTGGLPLPVTAPNPARITATGNLAALNDAATVAVDGMNTGVVQLSTGWTGTAVFEASADGGTTWSSVNMVPYAGGLAVSSTSAGGLWELAVGGLTHLRVRATTAITSGPAAAIAAAANGLKSIRVGTSATNPLPVNQGNPTTAGDTATTTAATAQTIFAGATPANGFSIFNPDGNETLWWSDSTTAAPNGQGSFALPPLTLFATEPGQRAVGPISVYAATAGHKITARRW